MNSEQKLFKHNFIKKISTSDVDSLNKQNYQKFHEEKHNKQNLKNDTFNKIIQNKVKYRDDLNNRDNTNVMTKKSVVSIDSRIRDTLKFPYAYNFDAPFGKDFKNVKSIRLVSTEIPNSDQVIRKTPSELQNNIFYWQNQEDDDLNYINNVVIQTIDPDSVNLTITDHNIITSTTQITIYNSKLDTDPSITGFIDGTYIGYVVDSNNIKILYKGGILGTGATSVDLGRPLYFVEFKPGNYTATTLTEQIEYSINFVKRRNNQGQYHYFSVGVNLDTDVMHFDSVITNQLVSNPISTTAASEIITVSSIAHGFKTGDRVTMIDVKTTGGIPASTLSGEFIITVIDFNTFTYEVNTRANESTEGGGNTVKTGKDAPFRFLLDTQNTLIQYNTGFPDEDSSEYIGAIDPITTHVLSIENLEIIGDYLKITTTTDHQLVQSTILTITNISTDDPCEITTSTPHLFENNALITIRDSNSVPSVNGEHVITPTGVYTFTINRVLVSSGNSGEILFNGDKIHIGGIKTTPRILAPFFYVENISAPNVFQVKAFIDHFDLDYALTGKVETSQIFINHPNHNFNLITDIAASGTEFARIRTLVPFNYFGSFNEGISVIDGPVDTNFIDILLTNHGLVTSDEITIINSTSVPSVDGIYKIQVVTTDIIRINFVHSVFVDGIADMFTGQKVNLSKSNSLPKIDGYWYIVNQVNISDISTGVTQVTITTTTTDWYAGDTIIISGTDSVPSIDGTYLIASIVSPTQFVINVDEPVILNGSTGKVQNKNSALIYTGEQIISSGDYAILGRNQNVIHYRIEAEEENGDNLGGIPIDYLNGYSRPIAKIIDANNYMVRIENVFAKRTVTKGGNTVRVSSELHGHRTSQSNTDTGGEDGDLFRSISLEGENYIYLLIPGLETVSTSNASINNVFAKIILTESPGLMCFNSFISAPMEFDPPLSKLNFLNLKMIDYRGYYFDFHDLNYSLSLEITELKERLNETNLVSGSSKKLVLAGSQLNSVNINQEIKDASTSVKGSASDTLGYGRFGVSKGGDIRN